MREAKFEDLLTKLIHNLAVITTQNQESYHVIASDLWFLTTSLGGMRCLEFSTLFLTWAGVPMGKPRRRTMQGVLEIKRTR